MPFCPAVQHVQLGQVPKIRTTQHPNGITKKLLTPRECVVLAHANRVTKHTLDLMTVLSAANIPVSIENPSASLVYTTKQFKKWSASRGAGKTIVDYCMYGEGFRKRTALFSTPPGLLTGVCKICPRGLRHLP